MTKTHSKPIPRDDVIAALRHEVASAHEDRVEQTRIALSASEARNAAENRLKVVERERDQLREERDHLAQQLERAKGWIDRVLEQEDAVRPRPQQDVSTLIVRGPNLNGPGLNQPEWGTFR